MTWQKRNPPGERRVSKNCAQASNIHNNETHFKPLARQFQALPIGSPATEKAAELRFRRDVARVHALGARVVGELLSELGSERAIQHLIDCKVRRYAAIDPIALAAVGGDKFGPLPLHLVAP